MNTYKEVSVGMFLGLQSKAGCRSVIYFILPEIQSSSAVLVALLVAELQLAADCEASTVWTRETGHHFTFKQHGFNVFLAQKLNTQVVFR